MTVADLTSEMSPVDRFKLLKVQRLKTSNVIDDDDGDRERRKLLLFSMLSSFANPDDDGRVQNLIGSDCVGARWDLFFRQFPPICARKLCRCAAVAAAACCPMERAGELSRDC